jgi:hypothetical protein
MLYDPQTAFGLVVLGLVCAAVLYVAIRSPLGPWGNFAAVTPTRATQRAPRGPAPQRLLSKGKTCIGSAVVAAHRPWGVAVACQRLPTRPKGQGANHLPPCCARAARRRLMRSSTILWS